MANFNYKQSIDFIDEVIDKDESLLEKSVKWISENLDVDDVFSTDEIVRYVKNNIKVEDVFAKQSLEEWAVNNGYIKEE